MAHLKDDDIIHFVKELITRITPFQRNTEVFDHVENYVVSKLKSADSMVFISKKDIDGIVSSLSDKFVFHGFCSQADDLKRFYENFIPAAVPKQDVESKVNTMKLLLCLSESPTNNFLNFPSVFIPVTSEEVIDWPAYLKEGLERWSPPIDDSSDSWTEDSKSDDSYAEVKDVVCPNDELISLSQDYVPIRNIWDEYRDVKVKLLKSVQHTWFTKDHVYKLPASRNIDANIAIQWDEFLQFSTRGLITVQKSTIITEYDVMREVLWQLWEPHTSIAYQFIGNDLVPRQNVTISSVRPVPFEKFMLDFLPHIELLQSLRDFHASLALDYEAKKIVPETYRSYDCAVSNIIKPIYDELLVLENKIMAQESIMTLIKLAHCLRTVFENARILKDIHDNVILDFKTNTPLHCATTLLSRLHIGLLHCVTKTEQDIYLSLYLETLYKYFSIMHSWLNEDALTDLTGEFIIADENPKDPHVLHNGSVTKTDSNASLNISKPKRGHCDWQMEFAIRELDEVSRSDSFLKIICTEVLQIGKNIHLLRLLGKLHLLRDWSTAATLHEELIGRVLQEIAAYFKDGEHVDLSNEDLELDCRDSCTSYKFPAICPDYCKYPTEMDRLENLVDTSDGFLMNAFSSFFVETPKTDRPKEETVYERISKVTKNIFPVKQIIDDVFLRILKENYIESGYMVKSLLINEYKIGKHFELFKHIYLFKDDIIFLLYRRIFEQVETKSLGNDIWLTTQLQDIIMDMYPDFYEKCSVRIKDDWRLCRDPLETCKMEYKVNWPINMIIKDEHMDMYSELFHLILKIKWGLYTLNHLFFYEIEPKKKPRKQHKIVREFVRRLRILRFCLINEFSSIQHYIFGYVCNKCVVKFQSDFEKAYNLDTLMGSHNDFINQVYSVLTHFRDFNESSYGFKMLLYLVRTLRFMWQNPKEIEDSDLATAELSYRRCHEYLHPIMYPRDILDN